MKHEFYMTEMIVDEEKEGLTVIPHENISFFIAGYMSESDKGARNMVTIGMKCGRIFTIACYKRTESDKASNVHVDTADHIIGFLMKDEIQGGGFNVKNITVS